MRVVFENQSTATEAYPIERQKTVVHDDLRSYTMVGESYANLSIMGRLYHVMRLVGHVFKALFTNDWNSVKQIFSEVKSGKEKVIHHIPTRLTPEGQREFTEGMVNHLNSKFKDLIESTVAATCFLHVQFEHGEAKRQFIFKQNNGTPFTQEFIDSKLNQIKENVSLAIQPEWGGFKIYEWMNLSLQLNENSKSFHYENRYYYERPERGESTGGSGSADGADALSNTIEWIKSHGWFMAKVFEDGSFVPGQFYQELA